MGNPSSETVVDVRDSLIEKLPKRVVMFRMQLPVEGERIINATGRFNEITFEILAANLRRALAVTVDRENWRELAEYGDE